MPYAEITSHHNNRIDCGPDPQETVLAHARVVPGVAVQLYYGKIFKDQAL